MRALDRLAGRSLATAAVLLTAAPSDTARSGQVRSSLQVTVQVVAACGGTLAGGTVTPSAGCPPSSAPMAVLSEVAAPSSLRLSAPTSASVESAGAVRYITLLY